VTGDLALLADWLMAQAWTGFAVFLRVGAMVALLPAFGEQSVPARVRVALALGLTLIAAPAVAPMIGQPPAAPAAMGAALLAEILTGLMFGLLLRLLVMSLATAGVLIAQGLSLAQMFGAGPAAEPMPVFSHLLVGAGLAFAAVLGLHVQAAGYVIGSYDAVPFGFGINAGDALQTVAGAIAASFGTAISLAAPFLIAALVYNLAIGAINRAMPQLMVTFIGAPALTAGGLMLLVLAVPVALSHWAGLLGAQIAAVGPVP
jgi:flagellar biosynthetic protein FliR